jgi:hypothetical protein
MPCPQSCTGPSARRASAPRRSAGTAGGEPVMHGIVPVRPAGSGTGSPVRQWHWVCRPVPGADPAEDDTPDRDEALSRWERDGGRILEPR